MSDDKRIAELEHRISELESNRNHYSYAHQTKPRNGSGPNGSKIPYERSCAGVLYYDALGGKKWGAW